MKLTHTLLAGFALAGSLHAGFKTSEPSYLTLTPNSDFTVEPILTVGDLVPRTGGGAGDQFAFVGIPDAMGLYKDSVTGQNILFIAHEIPSGTLSEPFPGLPKYKGAWVTRYVLENDASIASGSIAHRKLFLENTLVSENSPLETDTASFTRFCSGSFAGREHGMDRPLFFTNEESSAGNYDAAGSQSVVIADGAMHTLPALGRVIRETTIVQPRRDSKTVILSSEDGGSPSYLYIYVGEKQRRSSSVLDKNGLTGGKIYVLAARDAQHNEGTFFTGSLPTKWVEIPNGASLSAGDLLAAADDAGAFGFVRVEDIEFDPVQPTRSAFVATTGGSGPNRLGRIYELTFNPVNPIADGSLNVILNSDAIVTPGGAYTGVVGQLVGSGATGSLGAYTGGNIDNGVDAPISADNIAVSKDFILINEDRNAPADAVFNKYARNGGFWTLNRNSSYAAKLQGTFNYAYVEARDAHSALTPRGLWESSGTVTSDAIFGPGSFVINVQGHSANVTPNGGGAAVQSMRTNAPKPAGGTYTRAEAKALFVEDGQLLVLRKKN